MAVDGYSSCSIPTFIASGTGIDPAPLPLNLTPACDAMNESLQSLTPPTCSPECPAGTGLLTVDSHFPSVDAGDASPTDLLPQVDGEPADSEHPLDIPEHRLTAEHLTANTQLDLSVLVVRLDVPSLVAASVEPLSESDVISARVTMPLLCGSGSDADATDLDLVSCTCSVLRQSDLSRSPASSSCRTRMSSDHATIVGPCVVHHHEAEDQQGGATKEAMGTDYDTLPPAPPKSALKKAGNPSRGHRVCFNEACNTFLECDYVIYVDDDDEDDIEYQVYRPLLQLQQHQQHQTPQGAGANRGPQLVNVTSFNLQFPESCTYNDPPVEFVDQVTLSPPEGYKDAGAAFETLVDDSGSDSSVETEMRSDEDNTPVESPCPAVPALEEEQALSDTGNGTVYVDTHSSGNSTQEPPSPPASAPEEVEGMQERTSSPLGDHVGAGALGHCHTPSGSAAEKVTSFSDPEPELVEEAPETSDNPTMIGPSENPNHGGDEAEDDEDDFGARGAILGLATQPKHGILKGGKTWRGVGEARTGVRFVDDPNTDNEEGEDLDRAGRVAASGGEDSKTGHGKGGEDDNSSGGKKGSSGTANTASRSNSAFQQLFPRARKLLQDYPENSPGSAGSNNNAGSGKEIPSYRTIMLTEAEVAQKYEGRRRVREAMELGRNEGEDKELMATPAANWRAEENRARSPVNIYESQQAARAGSKGVDSLVERLRWLTDMSDEQEETTDGSPLASTESQASEEVAVSNEATEVDNSRSQVRNPSATESQAGPQETDQRPQGFPQVLDVPVIQMTATPAPDPCSTTGSKSSNTSTYKKLNELFFKSKKDKSKDKTANSQQPPQVAQDLRQWKINKSVLNRSLSPPPPSEVEPKLRPIRKHHVVHILPKKVGLDSQGELLGRLPNVVPQTDQIYHSNRQSVLLNPQQKQQQRHPQPPPIPTRGHLLRVPDDRKDAGSLDSQSSGADSYSLEDIEAVLNGDPSGANTACAMHMARAMLAEELRHEDAGGSRSSGSSGDSGLGSHDNSMTNGDLELTGESDELAQFVRQGLDRIERMRQRYNGADDETEDYGFLRRPSVRGIKPRFSTTSEILQQMQAQLQPPALATQGRTGSHSTWPYPQDEQANPATTSATQMTPTTSGGSVDLREKRRSMLPALQEETHAAGYFTLPHQEVHHPYTGAVFGPRHPGVLQVYASTGDLFQHVGSANQQNPRPILKGSKEAPGALLLRQHPSNPIRSQTLERVPSQQQQQHANISAYGTARRAPPAGEPYQRVELVNPGSLHTPRTLSPTQGPQDQQYPLHPHYHPQHPSHAPQQHYPLKPSSSTPALIQTVYQHPHPHRGLCPMNSNPALVGRPGVPHQEGHVPYNPNADPSKVYPTLQGTHPRQPPIVARRMPYGMVSPVDSNRNYPIGTGPPTLPPPIPSRSTSHPASVEGSTVSNFYDPKVLYANTSLGKGEREAPEGASSSPGLATDLAYSRDAKDLTAPPYRPSY